MSDSFNSAYLAVRKDRNKAEMDRMMAEDEAYIQAQQPAPAPSPAAPAPAAPPKKSPGVVSEALKAVGGGVLDAGRNAINAIDDAATWLDNNFLDLRLNSSTFGAVGGRKATGQEAHKESLQVPELPSYMQNETGAGKLARSVTQFVVPFLGATKALKAASLLQGAGTATVAARGAAAGAATDFAAFDPREQRLSNLILDFTDGNPAVGKPILEYLAAHPGDGNAEGRFKNTLEGLGLGVATEGLFYGAKAAKAHFQAKGKAPLEALQEAAGAGKEAGDLTSEAVSTAKEPDLSLANQIELLTGVQKTGPSKFQKALDMKAALADADKAAQPKGLELADGALAGTREAGNPDAFLKNGSKDTKLTLEDPNAVPFEKAAGQADVPSFPDSWKMVEQDPSPRRMFLDTQDGHVVMAKEAAGPHQMDLDLTLPDVLKKTERTPDEDAMLAGYKELQDKVLEAAPKVADDAASEVADLEARITKAQSRVDSLLEAGKDTATAQKVLDNLLKKRDVGMFDHSTKLSAKEADGLAGGADTVVDEIARNNEKILAAMGKQQGGFVSPSVLANMASMQVGGVTGYLSAEDDATMAERFSLAGMGALAGWGIKVGASKVLKGSERAVIDAAPAEVRALARKEVANIAPVQAAVGKKPPVIRQAKVESLVKAAKEGGMESLARAVKESDFNFAHIDTADEVKETIDAFSAAFEKETDLAKHGTQSFGDIKELANELGAGEKSLRELYQGTNNLGARILAHRALLTASAEQVTKLARLASSGDAEGILALRKHVALHASIQAQMKGVQTEVARALGQFRIQSTSIDLAINERNQLIDAMGGHAANIKFAQQLADITDPAALNAVIRKGAMARGKDALYEAWVNGLLSGPVTHVVNMTSNGLVAIASPAERLLAGMYGKVLRPGEDIVRMGEAKAQLYGMLEGLKDATRITKYGMDTLKKAGGEALHGNFSAAKGLLEDSADEFGGAWRAAATDAPVLDNAAFGTRQYDLQESAISAANLGFDQASFMGKFVDGLGAMVRTPGRLLTTSDEIFKTIHYRGELKAQAYRQATSEGLHGDELFKRVASLTEDPTPELSAMALDAARKGTFTNPLGEMGGAAQNLINKLPGGRWIVPFVRTPTNIMKFVGERTPGLNLLAEGVRAEFAAGGARRDMMLAKTTMGGAMYALGGYMAAQGMITGGGEKVLTAEKLSGWQPYSIKVGDTYVAYNRMDPFGMFLGLAADAVDLSGHLDPTEMGDFASMATLAVSRNLVSKSYMKGVIDLIDAFQQPEGKMDRYLQNLIGTVVPAAANAARKEDDPLAREVWSYTDAIKNRLPGYSKDLPPVRNVFGEPQKLAGGLGPDMVSPFRTSVASTDPLATEVARLNIDLKKPPKTLHTAPGAPGVDLTPQQYDRLTEIAGGLFKTELGKVLNTPFYKELPEDPNGSDYREAKETVIRRIYQRSQMEATRSLLAEDEELRTKWVQDKRNAAAALSGRPELPF